MKELMNGLRWDTDECKLVAEWWGGRGHTDSLYKTKSGKYLLVQVFTAPGKTSAPLSDDEAFGWLKDHQLIEAIDELFPGRLENA